jgi:alpha/beta hydrolase fold
VLLSNLRWDSHVWSQNLPALAANYHVLAVDLLGTGESAKPPIEYKMDTWTDFIAEFLHLKGIHKATIVGAWRDSPWARRLGTEMEVNVENGRAPFVHGSRRASGTTAATATVSRNSRRFITVFPRARANSSGNRANHGRLASGWRDRRHHKVAATTSAPGIPTDSHRRACGCGPARSM